MTDETRGAGPSMESVIETVPGIIYIFNQKTQSNEYTNQRLSNMLGYSSQEAQDMGDALLVKLCHPDDFPKVVAHFDAIRAMRDEDMRSIEYRIRHKDGHWVWLLSHDKVFERDEDGSVLRHIGIAADISKQKYDGAAQTAAVNDELETVFNAASSGIVALNKQGKIVRINSRARHMLGGISTPIPFDWPKGIKFLDPETVQPLNESANPFNRALSGQSLQNETHLLRRVQSGDDRRFVRVASAKVQNPTSDVHVVLVVDDISNEERNRQVIERKNRLDALGQLTGGIAHDFNNVLASLLYAVNLANLTDDEEKRGYYLDTATESIRRGSALTTRLLAFARRQPGLSASKKTADILAAFDLLVRPMIEAQITLELSLVEPQLRHYCDQAQLETALMNLVLNARDAIVKSGKGNHIRVSAKPASMDIARKTELKNEASEVSQEKSPKQKNHRYVEISVSDNGPGMDAETLERCTDPFFTTKESNSGTGLGLAIVYGFVCQSDGDLRIHSELGVGTTVKMILPRGAELGGREDVIPDRDVTRGSGQTLLVVEDEEPLLVMVTEVLEGLGYNVVTAQSGQEAVKVMDTGTSFDLLLTDVVMPGEVGGFELARQARERRPKLPVVYMSGYSGFTASAMGAVQAPLIQKPSPAEQLGEVISKALAQPIANDG